MKTILLCLLAVSLLPAQPPRVGDIEFYGLHKLSEQKLLHTVHLKAGGALPPSKGDLEDELEKVPGVVASHVEAICCDKGQTTLFIGIEEKGAPHVAFHSAPAGEVTLPDAITDTYRKFLEAVRSATHRGSSAEDLTHGHSLMADPDAREFQLEFADYAELHLPLLRDVLRDAADEEQRAMAAAIIGYAPNKKEVVNDLEYALEDPDESVRANAMRALQAIAVLSRLQPERGIRVSPTWFVELLNSTVLGDRTHAAAVLVTLSEQPGDALVQIRERALDSVVEMARWRALTYALPAFILVGRLAGFDEPEIQKAWTSGDRNSVIAIALAGGRKKEIKMGPVK